METVTTFEALEEKYKGFVVPSIKMKINHVPVDDETINKITQLTLTLSCLNDQKNVLRFTVDGLYDYAKESYDDKIVSSYFKLGNDIKVELGYINTVPLFCGYISSIQYAMDVQEGTTLTITCMDFKSVLANKKGDDKRRGGNRADEVENILTYYRYKKYATLALGQLLYLSALNMVYTLALAISEKQEQHDPMATELDKVVSLANNYFYEFFVIYDQIYFRPKFMMDIFPILSLSPEHGILNASMESSIENIMSEVEVRGEDFDELDYISAVEKRSILQEFTTNTVPLKKELFYDGKITSTSEAIQKAKGIMEKNKWQAVEVSLSIVGLPDIVPGRRIKLSGVLPQMNRGIYVTEVTHQMNRESGYTTDIKGRVNVYG